MSLNGVDRLIIIYDFILVCRCNYDSIVRALFSSYLTFNLSWP